VGAEVKSLTNHFKKKESEETLLDSRKESEILKISHQGEGRRYSVEKRS